MTRQQFDALVKEIEARYAGDRRALQRRALSWAAVGYGGFLAWIAAVAALCVGFVFLGVMAGDGGWIFFILSAVVFAVGGWWVARALWIRLRKPEGREITKAEAPRLFACLEELRAKCSSVPFHSVLITTDFNAGVTHIPRLGWLGWPRHYLLIGLPLLELLTEAEMTAALAHEFAHLSKKHGRIGHWIYRLRLSWDFLFAQYLNQPEFEGEISSRVFLRKYVSWFWPRFNAYAFVLSRSDEYEADSTAASIAGSQAMADALARIRAVSEVLEEKFWPDVWQQAVKIPEPPQDLFEQLASALRSHFQSPKPELLASGLRQITTNNDTHPCLRERLQNLGFKDGMAVARAVTAVPPAETAASRLLGSALEPVRQDLNALWRKTCAEIWRKRHARGISLDHHLKAVEQSLGSRADVETLWDKARALMDMQNEAAAEPLLREILALSPRHPRANFALGRKLLADDQAEGVAHIERAMAEDAEAIHAGCALLHDFNRLRGDAENVAAISRRIDEHEALVKASATETQMVTAADNFIPHGLKGAQLAKLVETLRGFPELERAYLGRKELKAFKDQRLFLLCIEARRKWRRFPNSAAEEEIVSRLMLMNMLPGRALIFAASGPLKDVGKKVMRVAGAVVFPAA